MAQEYQYIQDILKEFYSPVIVNQVYKKTPVWAQLKKSSKGIYGKRIVIPVQLAFTEAVGSRVANDYSLPTAQRNRYDQSYIYTKRLYGRIQVDGLSIAAAKGKGGWTDILSAETKGVSNAFAIELDRQSMGRGTSILGTVVSVDGANIVVDAPHGIAGDTPQEKWFRVGMVIDGYDVADSTKHVDGLQIMSINKTTHTLAMSAVTGIANLADGDYLVRTKSWSATTANLGDFQGIDGIVDTVNPFGADFQGIDRGSEEDWQAYKNTSAITISETAIQEGLDEIEKRSSGEAPDLAVTGYALRNKLISLMQSDRLIDTMELKAGWKAIKYIGGNVELPILIHKYCPAGYWYNLSLGHITFYTLQNLVWDNKGGGIVKPVSNYDAYESWFKLYGNIGTDDSNTMGKWTGLTTT